MKFKKEELIRLSPRVVADHLRRHGWRYAQEVKGKGSIWLYNDDVGDEYEIMLPTSRELGDFAIRMSEALCALGVVEERTEREVYSKLVDTEVLPSEILECEIAVEEGLEWNAGHKSRLRSLMEALDDSCISAAHGTFVACLSEIVEELACSEALVGEEETKKAAVWRSCKKILLVVGSPVQDNVSETKFWDEARARQAEVWFHTNFPQDTEPPDGPEIPDEHDIPARDDSASRND